MRAPPGQQPFLDDGDVQLLLGDCVQVMASLPAESVDAVVTDPPYGLEFMGKEWDRLTYSGGNPSMKTGERPITDRDNEWQPGSTYGARLKNPRCRNCGKLARGNGACKCPEPRWDTRTSEGAFQVQAWHETWAREALRVLRPGGHLLAFGGTRTFHRLTCAIEDAGFEVRDCLSYLYGSGFPKSLDVSKAIDRAAGAEREVVGLRPIHYPDTPSGYGSVSEKGGVRPGGIFSGSTGETAEGRDITAPATPEAAAWQGWGTALKPAWEPIVVARKPLAGTVAANVLAHGTGALNVDGCRVGHASDEDLAESLAKNPGRDPDEVVTSTVYRPRTGQQSVNVAGRWPANVVLSHTPDCREVGTRKVKGSAPASGPTLHATRSVAHGDYDGERGDVPCYGGPDGTETIAAWECSPDCPVRMLDEEVGELPTQATRNTPGRNGPGGMFGLTAGGERTTPGMGESGGPSRFFYTAKASSAEREAGYFDGPRRSGSVREDGGGLTTKGSTATARGETPTGFTRNHHPTVKPLALMRWLVRLVTPPGGLVLDPFAGSGTTGLACREEGLRALLIEREAEYAAIARGRLAQLSLFG